MPEGTGPPPVAPLVESVLNAAHYVAAAGLEMDSRLDLQMHSALLRLVQTVYEHADALELQRELEADGIREAHVFNVTAEAPPITSYPGHVERILAAADDVVRVAAAPSAAAVPQYALKPVCTLAESVAAYHAQASVARDWQEAGHRPHLLRPDDPDDRLPPPSGSSPLGRRAGSPAISASTIDGADADTVATVAPHMSPRIRRTEVADAHGLRERPVARARLR
jgi:hypothetical protein